MHTTTTHKQHLIKSLAEAFRKSEGLRGIWEARNQRNALARRIERMINELETLGVDYKESIGAADAINAAMGEWPY
jgi:hypothetical protein